MNIKTKFGIEDIVYWFGIWRDQPALYTGTVVSIEMDREEELTYEVLITHVAHPNTEWQCWYGEDCVRHFYENELFTSEESLKKKGERSFLETKVAVAMKTLDTLETALLENEKKFEELPHAIDGLHRAIEAQRKELKELRARIAELDKKAAKKKRE